MPFCYEVIAIDATCFHCFPELLFFQTVVINNGNFWL